MTTYRECPFCGKAIEQVVAGHIVPGCKCFTKIERGPRIMPVLIPASIWQSRPYVDALERKLAEATTWHDGPEIPPKEWVVVEFEDDDGFRWFDLACSVEGTFFVDCNPKLLRWTRSTLAMPVPDVKGGT